MIRTYMKNRHEPANGTYGDCLRACVSSVLECDDVPHFHSDGEADDAIIRERLDTYLRDEHGLTSWFVGWHETLQLELVMSIIAQNNPGRNYILFGALSTGEPHAVVCRDNEVIHDPSPWHLPGNNIVKPWLGVWTVLTFVGEVVHYANGD